MKKADFSDFLLIVLPIDATSTHVNAKLKRHQFYGSVKYRMEKGIHLFILKKRRKTLNVYNQERQRD